MKRIKKLSWIFMFALIALMITTGCTNQNAANVQASSTKESQTTEITTTTKEVSEDIFNLSEQERLLIQYGIGFDSVNYHARAYFADKMPEQVLERDRRIDSVQVMGDYSDGTYNYTVYAVESSYPIKDRSNNITCSSDNISYLVFKNGEPNYQFSYAGKTVRRMDTLEIKDIVVTAIYNLISAEYSITLDGNSHYFGLVSQPPNIPENTQIISHVDWYPVYFKGDYYAEYDYKDMTIHSYYSDSDQKPYVNYIETTRSDISTYHGIRIGDSRQRVIDT